MTANHNFGHWWYSPRKAHWHISAVYDEQGDLVCTTSSDDRARLIAAAPDLLDALKSAQESIAMFIGVHGYPSDSGAANVWNEVSAAIAKAEGW